MLEKAVESNRTIGTNYPMIESPKVTDFSDIDYRIKTLSIDSDKYIFYSNISNDFQLDEIRKIEKWHLLYEVKNMWIYMRLYERPSN